MWVPYSVREVDSHDSHASVDHVGQHGQILTGGADGGNDLGQRESLFNLLRRALQSYDFLETRGQRASGDVQSIKSIHGAR